MNYLVPAQAGAQLLSLFIFATMARWYGAALTSGGSVEKVTSWPARVRAVTPEAVQNAARTCLDKRRSVTGYLVKETPPEEKRS